MKIIIEDYYGNDLCELNINTFTNLSQINNLIDCNICDIDVDEDEIEYLRIQLESI